jgi:hypothetical protein
VILVDTSVWIDHLHRGSISLRAALEQEEVMTHPFVIGELSCGSLKNRREVLELLADLPSAVVADHAEILEFIEARHLMGKGIGYIDVHLLASAVLMEKTQLWTRDKRLVEIATSMRLNFEEPV